MGPDGRCGPKYRCYLAKPCKTTKDCSRSYVCRSPGLIEAKNKVLQKVNEIRRQQQQFDGQVTQGPEINNIAMPNSRGSQHRPMRQSPINQITRFKKRRQQEQRMKLDDGKLWNKILKEHNVVRKCLKRFIPL